MIDTRIKISVYQALKKAQNIFNKKTLDYGTESWRVFRMISLSDQLFIKARRIGEISTGIQKVTGAGNDIHSEFSGLINYAFIGVIQNRLEGIEPWTKVLSSEKAIEYYNEVMHKAKMYFESQHDYLAYKIQGYSMKKFSEKLQLKCQRIKYISRIKNEDNRKMVLFGAFMEIFFWAVIGYSTYNTTQ